MPFAVIDLAQPSRFHPNNRARQPDIIPDKVVDVHFPKCTIPVE